MSQSNIPNITPIISIEHEDSINLLLASIALGELGLSHVINAEGEKLQYVLGTAPSAEPPEPPTISGILAVSKKRARYDRQYRSGGNSAREQARRGDVAAGSA